MPQVARNLVEAPASSWCIGKFPANGGWNLQVRLARKILRPTRCAFGEQLLQNICMAMHSGVEAFCVSYLRQSDL
jgi:hypothetical protein